MSAAYSVPSKITGYTILALSLPPLASCPFSAYHYLYLAPHEPRIPSATAARSLFLVNIPLDATEAHIKHLFSSQLGLSHGRIEDVHFESHKKSVGPDDGMSPQPSTHENRGKKRKRIHVNSPIDEEEAARLPTTWDRDLQPNGGTAVVIFVDRASMEAVLRETKRKRKDRKEIVWGDGIEDKLPKLGSSSMTEIEGWS